MMWRNNGGWGAGDRPWMSFVMLAFWGLLIALAIWWVRGSSVDRGGEDHLTNRSTARADEVLAERFARGEIDEEEFTRRRESLHTTIDRS